MWSVIMRQAVLTYYTRQRTMLLYTQGRALLLPTDQSRESGRILRAQGTTYGEKIEYSGPLYDSMKISGNAIRIKFKYIGAGLEAHDGQLKGFAIAGADRKFHWAEARIEGESVVVSSAEVNAPVAV